MSKVISRKRSKVNRVPILVVEDNADHWLIIRAALNQGFPEVEPIWVNNSTQAVTYLQAQVTVSTTCPRLILVDLYLPRREDGLMLLEFIKSHTFYRQTPLIVLSYSSADEDIRSAYAQGIASYIIKPSSYHDWLDCIYTFRRYWWQVVTLPIQPQKPIP